MNNNMDGGWSPPHIRIPGTFVIFQGTSGDGLCNTMDYMEPFVVVVDHNNNDDEPDGEVLGASDSNVSNEPEPKGLVLGEQVSAVPTGAPDTGKGGTAETLVMGRLLVAPRRIRIS